jgi:hypothetical protein
VPLLEGFAMAHRMLDVQQQCLENMHLRERIADRVWQTQSTDNYQVVRAEPETTSENSVAGG